MMTTKSSIMVVKAVLNEMLFLQLFFTVKFNSLITKILLREKVHLGSKTFVQLPIALLIEIPPQEKFSSNDSFFKNFLTLRNVLINPSLKSSSQRKLVCCYSVYVLYIMTLLLETLFFSFSPWTSVFLNLMYSFKFLLSRLLIW